MLKHIPNFITSLNLLCGCIGIVFSFQGQLEYSVYSIWLAMVFDFLDGFSARILRVSSEIGKQLDSLADMITFGLLPSVIMFQLFSATNSNYAFASFLIAIFSALRLAKFNTDETQSDSFVGIPTPANALFISSLVFVIHLYPELINQTTLLFTSAICSLWLVMPVRLLALKFKNYTLRDNIHRYILILLSLISIVIFRQLAIPLIIILYLALSVIKNTTQTNNINS